MALRSPSFCNSLNPRRTNNTGFVAKPNSISVFSSPQNLGLGSFDSPRRLHLSFVNCSNSSYSTYDSEEQVIYPRPSEVSWQKELANSVQLIGIVGAPVQIKHLSSGKVLAWTRLAVKKSSTETTWIGLTFWNELGHIAFQHVEKGHRLYVSGRLVSDTVEGDDEKQQTYYKVVVSQLNFVEKSFLPSSFHESGEKNGNYVKNQVGSTSTEELWQAFFANPVDWWDNRKNKRNPKYPDFKHKYTGESLWVEAKYNPPWVKSQLAILDPRMESHHASFPEKQAGISATLFSGDNKYKPL